jgi:hypothetical protein
MSNLCHTFLSEFQNKIKLLYNPTMAVVDLERFNAEKAMYAEAWKPPVTIQFGAVFETLTGGIEEPYYGLGVVTDIQEGGQFKGADLARGEIDETTGETLPDVILTGGDWYRIHILRMTGEIITPEQFLEGERHAFIKPPPPEDEYWTKLRRHVDELIKKGSRILPGTNVCDGCRFRINKYRQRELNPRSSE